MFQVEPCNCEAFGIAVEEGPDGLNVAELITVATTMVGDEYCTCGHRLGKHEILPTVKIGDPMFGRCLVGKANDE